MILNVNIYINKSTKFMNQGSKTINKRTCNKHLDLVYIHRRLGMWRNRLTKLGGLKILPLAQSLREYDATTMLATQVTMMMQ